MRSILYSALSALPLLAQAPNGQAIYEERCATCHQQPANARIPTRADLAKLTPDQVAAALQSGAMVTQAAGLTVAQIRAVAAFVGSSGGATTTTTSTTNAAQPGMCSGTPKPFNPGPNDWSGWSPGIVNQRFQTNPGIAAADVPKLKLKWAFGFPGDTRSVAQPAIVGGRVFTGSYGGVVYSLDLATGCQYWSYPTNTIARTGIVVTKATPQSNQWLAIFGDSAAFLHALDAVTGREVWKVKLDDYPVARVTGTPVFHNGRVYVGMSSGEELASGGATYVCCKFRGSMMALDAATGRLIWKTHTIPEEAKVYRTTEQGRQLWGPAGAAIWVTPAIDTRRNRLYVGTGNSYTGVDIPTSDAVLAFDLDSGRIVWTNQITPKDNWLPGCPRSPICPEDAGDDYDIAASPILVTPNSTNGAGRDLLLVGQKSGVLYALNPDNGAKIWETRVGQGGGLMGGIMWGPSTDGQVAYVGVADPNRPDGTPGLYAIRVNDGALQWKAAPPQGQGRPEQPTATTLIPGAVFTASFGGHLRAHQTSTGEILWDFDVNRAFQTVNGVQAKGGSFDGAGPAVANGMVVIANGMGFAGGQAGNVLLAFGVE